MKMTAPLDIKVIYDASSRRRRRRVYVGSTAGLRSSGLILGIVNFILAGALYYGTWWQVDPFLYMTLIMKTPVAMNVDQAAAAMFGIHPDIPANQSASSAQSSSNNQQPRWGGKTARVMIPLMSYSWLTLATVASCALALSSGSFMGRATGGKMKMIRMIAFAGSVLVFLSFVWMIWSQYGMHYRPNHLRTGMAGLVLICLTTGMVLVERSRGLARIASYVLILSAVGSVVGLIFGYQCGAIEAKYVSIFFIAMVFVIHSLWGWILLALSIK